MFTPKITRCVKALGGEVRPFFTKSFILYRIIKPYSGAIQNAITELLHSVLRSQVMTQNVNVFVATSGHFIYKIVYKKWA